MSLSTPQKVRKLQSALHAKAKGSLDYRLRRWLGELTEKPTRPWMLASGSMSGMWKRSMVGLVRHRQTKEAATDRPNLNHRATSRLYRIQIIIRRNGTLFVSSLFTTC